MVERVRLGNRRKRNPFANLKNDPEMRGSLALPKVVFGGDRYELAPVHNRFRGIVWFVWDRFMDDRGAPALVRQEQELSKALAGLPTIGLPTDVLDLL